MRMMAALAIAGLALPAAAAADDARTAHDVQCFMVSSMLTKSDDGETQSAGLMSAMFFAGQIFGADPDIDLTAAAKAQLPSLTAARIETLRTECGAEMMKRGAEIKGVGEALQEEADDAPEEDAVTDTLS